MALLGKTMLKIQVCLGRENLNFKSGNILKWRQIAKCLSFALEQPLNSNSSTHFDIFPYS